MIATGRRFTNPDYIRRVILFPYRRGMGPHFILTLIDCRSDGTRDKLSYSLVQSENGVQTVIFEGSDFGPSPMHAIDSDDTIAALLNFLTLRPGDTDSEYFDGYTDVQQGFCEQHAEYLGYEAINRFGER